MTPPSNVADRTVAVISTGELPGSTPTVRASARSTTDTLEPTVRPGIPAAWNSPIGVRTW